jgi:single-strand DNA-binding protein
MNLIQIAGHLGADPEVRFTSNGQKVTTVRVATNSRKAGKDETIWWRVTIWGDRFDKMMPYLKKGSAIIVIGELSKPEIYTDKEGRPQVSLEMTAEVIRFSPFGKSERSGQEQSQAGQTTKNQGFGEQTFSAPTSSHAQHGYSSSSQESEEDPLPF